MPLDGRINTRVCAASRLSAIKVAKLKEPGLYEDGAGLRLASTDKGTKRWALRLTINGRRVERGLGLWPDVSLDEARRKAISFRSAFDTFFNVRRQRLSNGKHVKQWETTMET
jgi:Arm DNA-binding domain